MIDIERLRLACDADYETGSYLCGQAADEIERLRAALEFYADDDNYLCDYLGGERMRSAVEADWGERAKKAVNEQTTPAAFRPEFNRKHPNT